DEEHERIVLDAYLSLYERSPGSEHFGIVERRLLSEIFRLRLTRSAIQASNDADTAWFEWRAKFPDAPPYEIFVAAFMAGSARSANGARKDCCGAAIYKDPGGVEYPCG